MYIPYIVSTEIPPFIFRYAHMKKILKNKKNENKMAPDF